MLLRLGVFGQTEQPKAKPEPEPKPKADSMLDMIER